MRVWFALFAAPVLALTDQSVSFALAGWACAHQWAIAPHVVHMVSLAAAVMATFFAMQLWRATVPAKTVDETLARRHFLAGLATASGALSAAAIAAMWIPNWMLSPCVA